jgi:Cd2+/Zn2+-exporting ATPase
VERGSAHPLAEAVLARAAADGVPIPPARAARALPGRGVEAEVAGARVAVVSAAEARGTGALSGAAEARAAALEAEGRTVVAVLEDGALTGLIALRDEPRADAAEGVAALRSLGLTPVMLTGDNARTAEAIGGALGLDHRAGLLPADKVAEIRALATRARVMMIGDGINDAPALAAAQVGIAMGSGTDVALETADGALMRSRVADAARLVRLSRAAMRNIRQNIVIALGLKGVFLVTTVAGVTGLWPAILADTGATVLVTLNALRLLGFARDGRSPST